MRIMFVTPSMRFGGAERVMSLLANKWTERGHQVSLVIMDDEKQMAYSLNEQVTVQYMQSCRFDKPGKLSSLIRTLRRYILNGKPDVILSFFCNVSAFCWAASFGTGIPLIFSERNDPYNNINGIKAKLFQTVALRSAKHVVFQTAGARDYYGSDMIRKATIILNPFDADRLPAGNRQKEKILVSVGRLSTQKNQKVLIDAFAKVAAAYPEHKLVIYGEGPLRQQLQEQIDGYGLTDRILLPGNEKDIMAKLQKAELFVFSSDFEGLPNALIEAMATGLPCVSTDCSPGGARELIENYTNGILVPCGDAEKMAEAINYILQNSDQAEQMGREAKNITQRLDIEKIASQWEQLLKQVVKNEHDRAQ